MLEEIIHLKRVSSSQYREEVNHLRIKASWSGREFRKDVPAAFLPKSSYLEAAAYNPVKVTQRSLSSELYNQEIWVFSYLKTILIMFVTFPQS